MTLAPPFGPAHPAAWPAATRPEAAAAPAVNVIVRIALYLFVASIPFEMPNRAMPLEVPTLTGLVLLGASALNPSACYRRLHGAVVWFALYLLVYCASVLGHGVLQRGLVLRLFINLVLLVLIFWIGANLLADDRTRRGAMLSFVAACAARAGLQVLGVGATAHAVWTGGARVSEFGQNANLSALILSAGLVTVLGMRFAGDPRLPRLRVLAWPLAALIGYAIIQTGSRGGLLGAGVGLLVYALHGRTLWMRVRNAVLGAGALVVLGWGAYRSDVMRNRLEQTATEGALAGREHIYPTLVEMFVERPVAGWGPIENQFELAQRLGEPGLVRRDAHSLVLELLTATGVIGALPFLVGLVLCVASAVRARAGPRGDTPLALLVTVLMGTLSGTWIASKIVWLALAQAQAAGASSAARPAGTAIGANAPCAA